ncbi:hypothetical protein SJS73_13805 [Aeromonas caviae]|jgi:hypothetical protein|uniref:hypothetical protein n=1 Tax=Aeromonas TaxID=642 RepID=UPI000CD2B914|nr:MULTISPECIES: hypothetical protein [Aeromonas]AUV17084.1 hypothetical protein C2U47_11170 [Aeromonas sp. ASNIH7]MDM5109608.1 hypothetical protein [Aeromonas caviae]MDX7596304.1 hypothetical protein [Aeromonas caviae]MDX7726158.1 hypothetical protein [Aeromonas caviae]MDX7802498.1 hypothetical protein [Aeromonas caviae]
MTAVMDSPQRENARTYRSTPTTEMVTDNTLTCITKWHYVWKDSRGGNSNCDFTALKAYATDDHVRLLISKFQQSGWREATKVSRFIDVRSVLAHAFNAQSGEQKGKVEFSPETCTKYIHATYLSMASTGKGLNGIPIQAKMLGWRGSNLNSICRKFGFGQIPKAARNLDTRSAVLDSDNYTVNELRAIARALLEDRARLRSRYKDDTLSQSQKRVVFNRLVCNAVFLTIYYLGTGQTETLSMFLENEWVCKQSGTGRISIEGFKTRGEKVELRTFTPRAACKGFFEYHLELSKEHSVSLGLDKHYLFRKMNGKAPNTEELQNYAKKFLVKHSIRLQSLIKNNPTFRLNCNLLKSSIKQYAEQRMGREKAAHNTRNAPSTYDNSKYGKVSKGEARSQLAVGLTALHYLGENPSGGSIIAVAKAKETFGKVLSNEEWKSLKTSDTADRVVENINGGFCRGEDTPEIREFQMAVTRTGILNDEEKTEHGCGFVVKCFSCANFGIVDDPHDIWRLLSFEKRLNEAMLAHQNVKHFLNNYGEVKAKLNKLKEQFKKAHLKAAERLLERECHPLWDEESVMDIFRG